MTNLAFEKWKKSHKWDKRCKPIAGGFVVDKPVVLFYCSGDPFPYSVQFNGNGHYFETLEEAYEYAFDRWPWLKKEWGESDEVS